MSAFGVTADIATDRSVIRLLSARGGFEGNEFLGWGAIERRHASHDRDNECGGNSNQKGHEARRLSGPMRRVIPDD
jgi:hypothetical protein